MMGTRNITRVVSNGKVIVEQYCQWDGYPTGQGNEIMAFVKLFCGKKLGEFKKKIDRSSLYCHKAGTGTYTGSPYWQNLFEKVCSLDGVKYGIAEYKHIHKAVGSGKLTVGEASEYLVATRDSGPKVLYWLMRDDVKSLTFYTDDYLSGITDDLDWQIEGMYTLNLDEKWVEINYHGYKRRYGFNEVIAMSKEEIEAEMEDMEKSERDRDE